MDTPAQREAKLKAHNDEYHANIRTVASEVKDTNPEKWKELVDAWSAKLKLEKEFGKDAGKKAARGNDYYKHQQYDDPAVEDRRIDSGENSLVDLLSTEERSSHNYINKKMDDALKALAPALKASAEKITQTTDLSDGPQTDRSGIYLSHDNSPEQKALYASSLYLSAGQELHRQAKGIAEAMSMEKEMPKTTGTTIPNIQKANEVGMPKAGPKR